MPEAPLTLETIQSAVISPQFLGGLTAGSVALVAAIPVSILWRRYRPCPAPLGAILWTGAALVALTAQQDVSNALLLGLAALALGGLVPLVSQRFRFLTAILALPGAWIVSRYTGLEGPSWVPWYVMAGTVLSPPLTAATDRHLSVRGAGIVMFATTVGGVYGTVPDTEQALVLLGAMTPLVLLGVLNLNSMGSVGTYAAVGLLIWATVTGGMGRPASIVGGVACLGAFLVAPLARTIRSAATESWPLILVTHFAVVVVTSRVAGLRNSVAEAAVISTGALILGCVVLTVGAAVQERRFTVPDNRADAS